MVLPFRLLSSWIPPSWLIAWLQLVLQLLPPDPLLNIIRALFGGAFLSPISSTMPSISIDGQDYDLESLSDTSSTSFVYQLTDQKIAISRSCYCQTARNAYATALKNELAIMLASFVALLCDLFNLQNMFID